jgi:hypothetical protein
MHLCKPPLLGPRDTKAAAIFLERWKEKGRPEGRPLPDLLPVPEVSPPCPLPQTLDDQPWHRYRGQEQHGSAELEPRVQGRANRLQSREGDRECSDKNPASSRYPSRSFVAPSYNEVGTKPLVAAILHSPLQSCAACRWYSP